jgi:hypothetical protein
MKIDPVIEWQNRNLPRLKHLAFDESCHKDVTLITNWLWVDDRFDLLLDSLLCAILMTWNNCGRLPVTLIVNRITIPLKTMAETWGIRLLLKPNIKGGGGNARELNRDSIMNAAHYFDTEYMLTFQNHAFPVRPGLLEFLGKWDYIGAPWIFEKDDWITRLLLPHRLHVGNGAFTIRSRKLCEVTAFYFRKYQYLPHCYLFNDDYFIGKTLPSWEKEYLKNIRIAPPDIAATFSLEDNIRLHQQIQARPFGFHGPATFQCLIDEGQIKDL